MVRIELPASRVRGGWHNTRRWPEKLGQPRRNRRLTASGQRGGAEVAQTPDTLLLGTVGKDVTAVTLTLTDGTKVGAFVVNGIYAAWWPGRMNPVSAAARTATGATTTHLFTS
jgi:hypothetical protein